MNRELLSRRKFRNSYRIKKNNKNKKPILNIYKSNKNIYAQVVDLDGKIIVCASSKTKDVLDQVKGKSGVEIAAIVGMELAKKAKEVSISEIVFNKGPYLYIGRVKSLAEAAREGGLIF